MKNLIIVGASGCGREVLQWVKEINAKKQTWNIAGFLDDNLNALDEYECDSKVLGRITDWVPSAEQEFVVALADPFLREKVVRILEDKGAVFASVIHPNADIGSFNKMGRGVIIYPSARITVNTKIGDFAIILDCTTIGHDANIGDFVTICGGCGINGHVKIEDHVFIGSHVTMVPSRVIGAKAYVGTGSVIVNNVKAGYRVFGNPAKKMPEM